MRKNSKFLQVKDRMTLKSKRDSYVVHNIQQERRWLKRYLVEMEASKTMLMKKTTNQSVRSNDIYDSGGWSFGLKP